MTESDDKALHHLNEWYEAYRRAYIGWLNLASSIRATLDLLRVGDVAAAIVKLEASLRDHSPPVDA